MKKGLVLLGALALSACTAGFETDMDEAAAIREANIAERRQISGCTFARDNDAYRNCLLRTYEMRGPASYTTATMTDGRPVAVISQNSQGGSSGCGMKPLPSQEPGYEWAAPTTASHTQSVETVCQKQFVPQQTVVQTVEERVAPPEPEVIFIEPEQPVVVEQPVVQAAPVRKWTREVAVAPKCPCEDPNDPCPQCYDK